MGITRGGNSQGLKWNKGGSMKRNKFFIDWSQFADYAERINGLGVELNPIFTEVMEKEAKKVQEDTQRAVQKSNLPAKGKYSKGNTEKSIDMNPKVEWSGTIASIGIGFDKSKQGAGGFLITGTPRMRPDWELEKIFVNKKYQKAIMLEISNYFAKQLKKLEG